MLQKQGGPTMVRHTTPGQEEESREQFSTGRPPTKLERVTHALVLGERLHRLMAEHRLGDHALPSTISELHNRKGIKVERRDVSVPGYRGEPAHVSLYWLDPDEANVARAKTLLAAMRAKRGA